MASDISPNNKRIARNTLLLYGRMFFMFCISLYTSRVVLKTIGIEDYGIYNVVGGVISMFAFITAAMSSSTQRYITFYLGKGNIEELRDVFRMSMFIHFLIAIVILIIGETIGLWFVINKLVIPEDRINAALWVYQLSIVASLINIISVPYNAEIIAHERMSAFAYISILEAVLKLVIVYLLLVIPYDKLIIYAMFIVVIAFLIRCIYGWYCSKHFVEARLGRINNKLLFREMVSFAGWNLWGGLSAVLSGQGINILLNMFFGPVVNAARGIAVQVQGAILQFATNFQMALNPQITKTYAANQLDEMHNLIYRSSKFTFVLLFMICLPVMLKTECILNLWLEEVPNYTSIFIRIMLCITILDSMANPIMNANAATGKVKTYQLLIGGIVMLVLPLSYMFLKLGFEPWVVFAVHFGISAVAFITRLLLVRPLIRLSLRKFFMQSILPCILVLMTSVPIPLFCSYRLENSLINLILIVIVSIICISVSTFSLALTEGEKSFLMEKTSSIINN